MTYEEVLQKVADEAGVDVQEVQTVRGTEYHTGYDMSVYDGNNQYIGTIHKEYGNENSWE